MDRYFRERNDQGAGASPPSEAWLFAQALLGKAVPSASRAEADARAKREQLEWLAKISPEHESRLRRSLSEQADAAAERQQLQWLAKISTVHEAQWDPAKHPRLGGPPNAGWWATTGGTVSGAKPPSTRQLTSIGDTGARLQTVGSTRAAAAPNATRADTTQQKTSTSGSTARAALASYSGPISVVAQQVSWPPPVGHHWVPIGVTQHPDIRPYLSDEAVEYAAGAYSGPTSPPHGNATYGETAHPKYSAEVRKELKAFMDQRKIEKMTADEMAEFMELIKGGRGANGKPNEVIASFNRAIKGMVPKGTKPPTKMDEILAAGRKHLKHSRFKLLAAGAVISGILGEVVNQQVKILEVASNSGHYRRALKALQDGNLDKARNLLIGDHDSLYHEILGRVGAHAALNFKKAMEHVFAMAKDQDYK